MIVVSSITQTRTQVVMLDTCSFHWVLKPNTWTYARMKMATSLHLRIKIVKCITGVSTTGKLSEKREIHYSHRVIGHKFPTHPYQPKRNKNGWRIGRNFEISLQRFKPLLMSCGQMFRSNPSHLITCESFPHTILNVFEQFREPGVPRCHQRDTQGGDS